MRRARATQGTCICRHPRKPPVTVLVIHWRAGASLHYHRCLGWVQLVDRDSTVFATCFLPAMSHRTHANCTSTFPFPLPPSPLPPGRYPGAYLCWDFLRTRCPGSRPTYRGSWVQTLNRAVSVGGWGRRRQGERGVLCPLGWFAMVMENTREETTRAQGRRAQGAGKGVEGG